MQSHKKYIVGGTKHSQPEIFKCNYIIWQLLYKSIKNYLPLNVKTRKGEHAKHTYYMHKSKNIWLILIFDVEVLIPKTVFEGIA